MQIEVTGIVSLCVFVLLTHPARGRARGKNYQQSTIGTRVTGNSSRNHEMGFRILKDGYVCYNDISLLNADLSGGNIAGTFILCPNTTFADGQPPIDVASNSEIVIQCGIDGTSANNCVLGERIESTHISVDSPAGVKKRRKKNPKVQFRGLTLIRAKRWSVVASGRAEFIDCHWKDNGGKQQNTFGSWASGMIFQDIQNDQHFALPLRFTSCSFMENRYKMSLLVSRGGTLNIVGNNFERNNIHAFGTVIEVTDSGEVSIMDSTFNSNSVTKRGCVYVGSNSAQKKNKNNSAKENVERSGSLLEPCQCIFLEADGSCIASADTNCAGKCVAFRDSSCNSSGPKTVQNPDARSHAPTQRPTPNVLSTEPTQEPFLSVADLSTEGTPVASPTLPTPLQVTPRPTTRDFTRDGFAGLPAGGSSPRQTQCCDGSFAHIFRGPVYGLVPMALTAMSCAPVVWVMVKLLRGRIFLDGELEIDAEDRNKLLLSGLGKLATRVYAGLYASAAAGSAHVCNPNASSVINVCLNGGYGYEAFVLGYSGIASGLLDWLTLFRSNLPFGASLSEIRWQVINDKQCVCVESCILGVLLVLLAIVGAGGHILSAADTAGTILAVIIGIFVGLGAVFIVCVMTPFVVCGAGVCGTFRNEGDEGTVLAKCWEAVRGLFLELPGLIISCFGNPAGIVGWILEIWDTGVDFLLDHGIIGGESG